MLKSGVPLTVREQQVIVLLSKGLSNATIAAQLGLQEKTIKHHLTHIFRKISVSNRTEAAITWLELQGDSSERRYVGSSVSSSGAHAQAPSPSLEVQFTATLPVAQPQ